MPKPLRTVSANRQFWLDMADHYDKEAAAQTTRPLLQQAYKERAEAARAKAATYLPQP